MYLGLLNPTIDMSHEQWSCRTKRGSQADKAQFAMGYSLSNCLPQAQGFLGRSERSSAEVMDES
jgi:hypothetical protein